MPLSNHTNREWLYDQYVIKEKSVTEIAEHCKVTRESVIFSLDKFNIYRNWKRPIDKTPKK